MRARNVLTGGGLENARALCSHGLHRKDTKAVRVK